MRSICSAAALKETRREEHGRAFSRARLRVPVGCDLKAAQAGNQSGPLSRWCGSRRLMPARDEQNGLFLVRIQVNRRPRSGRHLP